MEDNKLYLCNHEKNTVCRKTHCFYNEKVLPTDRTCYLTKNKEYSLTEDEFKTIDDIPPYPKN